MKSDHYWVLDTFKYFEEVFLKHLFKCVFVFEHLGILDLSLCQDLTRIHFRMHSLLFFLPVTCLRAPVMVAWADP